MFWRCVYSPSVQDARLRLKILNRGLSLYVSLRLYVYYCTSLPHVLSDPGRFDLLGKCIHVRGPCTLAAGPTSWLSAQNLEKSPAKTSTLHNSAYFLQSLLARLLIWFGRWILADALT